MKPNQIISHSFNPLWEHSWHPWRAPRPIYGNNASYSYIFYYLRNFIFGFNSNMQGSGQLHALATLPQGKEPPASTEWEAGWALKSVWMFWRTQKLLTQITPPVARSLEQLGYPTSTSRYTAHRIMIHLKTCLFLIPQMPSIWQLTKFQKGKLQFDSLHKGVGIILVMHPVRPYRHHGISLWYGLLPL